MSFLYTFKDTINSCTHHDPEGYSVGEQKVPVCRHPENINSTTGYGYCDENVCPLIRLILEEGEDWE